MTQESFKKQAAEYTVNNFVESNMVVGLGMGSTSQHALYHLSRRIKSGDVHGVVGVPCGAATQQEAERLGIPLTTLDEHPQVDITFDGADEVDPDLNLIKGGGGALLREKIVAQASRQEIIMVDESKIVPRLGAQWAVPIEVTAFGLGAHLRFLENIGGTPQLRLTPEQTPFITDEGNYILDTNFGPIADPYTLDRQLKSHAGILEHGLFLDLATVVVIAGQNGIVVKHSNK